MAGIDGLTKKAQAELIRDLQEKLAKEQGKRQFVAVQNMTDNPIAYIRPFGAPENGSQDIKFTGYGDLQLVPSDKWEDMVRKREPDLVDGYMVRNTDVGEENPSILKTSLGEDFPNAILDDEIKKVLQAETIRSLNNRIKSIDNMFVLGRFLRAAKKLKGVGADRVEAVRKRAQDIAKKMCFPNDFEKLDVHGLMRLASKHNFVPQNLTFELEDSERELAVIKPELREQLRTYLSVLEHETMSELAGWDGEEL